MNAKIRSIDLKPGMHVIVLTWKDEAAVDPTKPMHALTVGEFKMVNAPRKPIGDPVRVLALALPLMTVEFCVNRARGVVDTRLMDLMQVDLAYVQSLVPQYREALPPGVGYAPAQPPASHANGLMGGFGSQGNSGSPA